MDLEKYADGSARSTVIIRAAMRDIDYETAALAMAGVPDVFLQSVLRNVSQETARNLRTDIDRHSASTSPARIEAACGVLYTLLERHEENTSQVDESLLGPIDASQVPPIRLDSKSEIVSTFVGLAELVRSRSLLDLENVASTMENPIAAKGLSMIISGYDPPNTLLILERMKQTEIRLLEERLAMIIDGIESLQAGDHPSFVESKLQAHIAQ